MSTHEKIEDKEIENYEKLLIITFERVGKGIIFPVNICL
jgi:hypothetical protein